MIFHLLKYYCCNYLYEIMNHYQQQKLYIARKFDNSLSNFQLPFPSNAIPYPLYTYLLLSLFFTILVAPNKQSLNIKFLRGSFEQLSKS